MGSVTVIGQQGSGLSRPTGSDVLGPYATVDVLELAHPAAENAGKAALVGIHSYGYQSFISNGVSWSAIELTTFVLPPPGGGNDTAPLQSVIDKAADAYLAIQNALARPLQIRVVCRHPGTYNVDALHWRSNLYFDWGKATYLKRANGTGNIDSNNQSVIRPRYVVTNGSRYGQADNITSVGGYFHANNKICGSGIAGLLWMRNCTIIDMAVQHADVPWAGGFGMLIGGRNLRFVTPQVYGGQFVGHDGWHVAFGEDISCQGGFIQSGDDAVAVGGEPWLDDYIDDEGISRIYVTGVIVDSTRGQAVKVYYPSTQLAGVRGRIRQVTVRCSGKSGKLRNGGVFIQNERTSAIDRTAVMDVYVHADVTVGSAEHDGLNAFGAQIMNVTNVKISGTCVINDVTEARAGYQEAPMGGLYTSLVNMTQGGTYTAQATVNGTVINISATGAQCTLSGNTQATIGGIFEFLKTFPALSAVADVTWVGGRIRGATKTKGIGSSFTWTDTNLFAASSGFTEMLPAVAGGIPYSQNQATGTFGFSLGNLSSCIRTAWDFSCDKVGAYEAILVFNAVDTRILPGTRIGGIVSGRCGIKLVPNSTSTTLFIDGLTAYGAVGSVGIASAVGADGTAGVARIAHLSLVNSDLTGVTAKLQGITGATNGSGTYIIRNNRGVNDNVSMYQTWASRPPAANVLAGTEIRLPIGLAGYHEFISDGASRWRAKGGMVVLGRDIGVLVTGTTAKTTALNAAFTVPGGLMSTKGRLKVILRAVAGAANANAKTVTIEFGGSVVGTKDMANGTLLIATQEIWNQNDAGVQSFLPGIGELNGLITANLGAAAVDTTVDQTVNVYVTLANAADSVRIADVALVYEDA